MKKVLMTLLAVSLLAVCVFTVNAAEVGGKCGDNLTWSLSKGVLTITGTGPMYNYSEENRAPWASISDVYSVVIENGVTSIGNYAFRPHNVFSHRYIYIAKSVTRIGDYAFSAQADTTDFFTFFFLGDPPQLGKSALGWAQKIYVVNWDDAAKNKLNQPASKFVDCIIKLDVLKSQLLLDLNKPLEAEDLFFGLYRPDYPDRCVTQYSPRQFSVSAYDNSTYGEKNVAITADGFSFDYTYFVTDGTNHLDLINVEFPHFPSYNGKKVYARPKVMLGSMELVKDTHYQLTTNSASIGNKGRITVKGKDIVEGFEKTFYFPVLRTDLSKCSIETGYREFTGEPRTSYITVSGEDIVTIVQYATLYSNNINAGAATVRAVGLGDYCGEITGTFNITLADRYVSLNDGYIGNVDGELSEDIPYYEKIVGPGKFRFSTGASSGSAVAIALYKFDGEEFNLIKEQVSSVSYLDYDLTHVYEDAADEGGEIYMVSHSWVKPSGDVYAGITLLLVPAKVPEATSMTLEYVEGDGDFRKEFLNVYGDDGVLGEITWETSDPSVAVVENGTVTFKKPGTVSVIAQWGNLVESAVVSATQQDLTSGIIFDYHEETGARVIWDGRLLEEGADYVLSVTKDGDAVTVTATGRGLFTGQLMKTFDGLDSLADPHTHSFDNICDGTCNSCDFTRANDHSFPQVWTKNQTHHWHACSGCGMQKDLAPHTLSPEDDTVCSICGPLHTPGDLNGDYSVNEDDAIYLLQHILLSEFFPLNQAADYTGDDRLDEDDAIYLLQHVLLPEFFPL